MADDDPPKGNGIQYSGALGKVGVSGTNSLWLLGFAIVAAAVLWQGTLFRSQMREQTDHFNHEIGLQNGLFLKAFTDQTTTFLTIMQSAEKHRQDLGAEIRVLQGICRGDTPPRRRRGAEE